MGNGWVVFGYVVTYGAIGLYVARLIIRGRSLRLTAQPKE